MVQEVNVAMTSYKSFCCQALYIAFFLPAWANIQVASSASQVTAYDIFYCLSRANDCPILLC